MKVALNLALVMAALVTIGCGDATFPSRGQIPNGAYPFEKIPSSGADPAENGPDDSTEIDGIPGDAGIVKFPHARHASNQKMGIPCNRCHHETPDGKDPTGGCSESGCHGVPQKGVDPAHGGPDDNLILSSRGDVTPVPFNHFTHASRRGYKLACVSCHHTGDQVACGDCHKTLPTVDADGTVVRKHKRAFHNKCVGCHEAIVQNQPDASAPVACEDCHRMRRFDTPRAPKDGLTRDRAFHLQCIGCHEAAKQAGGAKGAPTRECEGCHVRPKPETPATFAELAGELLAAPAAEVKPEFVRDPKLEEKKGPEHILIDHAKAAKSGTPFPHHRHQQLGDDCYTCHHKGLQDPTCRSCHATPADAKKVYHANCITCHKERDSLPGAWTAIPKM